MTVSDVTLFELCYGAERYDDPLQRLAVIEGLPARLEVLPFDSRAAQNAAKIRVTLERQGQMIGAYDVMIAGIDRSQGLVLVMGNAREFGRIEGLRVETWGNGRQMDLNTIPSMTTVMTRTTSGSGVSGK